MEKLCKKCERDEEEEVNLISQNSKALQKHMVKIVLDCFVLLILNCADKKFHRKQNYKLVEKVSLILMER